MKLFPVFSAVLAAMIFSGCQSQVREVYIPEKTPEMTRRAAAFSRTLSVMPVRYVVLGKAGLELYHTHYDKLIETIRLLGFGGVLCHVEDEPALESLQEFAIAAARGGLKVKLVFRESDYNRKQDGDQHRFSRTGEMAIEFNRDLPEDVKLSGAVFVVEPNLYSKGNPYRPINLLYAWDELNYGIGGDNDMLVKRENAQLKKIKQDLNGELPMAVGMGSFVILDAVKGKISSATVKQMLSLGEENIIFCTGSKPSEMERNFAAAADFVPGTPLIGLNLARHVSEAGKSLRRRDWNDLNRALSYILEKHNKKLSGIVIGPFVSLATLWERHPYSYTAPSAAEKPEKQSDVKAGETAGTEKKEKTAE